MKIKTFKFLITQYNDADKLYGIARRIRDVNVASEEEIDKAVNEWIQNAGNIEIKDIKINTVKMARHNNGGADINFLYYTIIYREIFDC